MGLLSEFTPGDFGFEEEIFMEVGDEEIVEFVDYSFACDAFVQTFLQVSRSLVPVRTGYLRSTLDAYTDGYTCTAITECDYAEYVEFGTAYMAAQPYFTPALEVAVEAFLIEAERAYNEALEMAEAAAQTIMDGIMEAAESTGLDFFGGLAASMIGLALLFPIILIGYEVIDALTGYSSERGLSTSGGFGGYFPNIEII